MLTQIATLRFTLGSNYDNIVIRDVQLWREGRSCDQPVRHLTGTLLQYVDLDKLPVWVTGSGTVATCFTASSTAVAYFTSKLRRERRGIVVQTGDEFLILHREKDQVRCLEVDLVAKARIDSQINALEAAAAAPTAAKDDNIDVVLRQSQERKSFSNEKVLKKLHASEKRSQFNQTLSKLILGGLRLRGIPNSQSGFQKLYKMTFSAAEFSHRKQLQALAGNTGAEIPFEELQATVETLLELFTRF
ncbi:hypothetical protein HG536_0H02640 [Torulaspora globosa]|uniref:Mitochondrial morphogenesis protein SLD7 n=1 Tax=Torulaspora globosa TaxID=48254 RepID=A0A7G3ZN03_9SACH|nr:uncharacterized protein HG536_0H02640 [Torulaspora globosa]QLL34889.1 hypothetical protein HG536_0H02640 [Torulaspora globosa]